MKNSLIDNQGTSLPREKKTKLEGQIAELQSQERQIIKQHKVWENKLKKANNLVNCLSTAEKFGDQFLTEAVENEKSKEQPDISWLEYLLKDKVEFSLKFRVGKEAFTKLIFESLERKARALKTKLGNIQSQLRYQERKFARLQARKARPNSFRV